MEHENGMANEEQYLSTRHIQDSLQVSRTKAYEIMREIAEKYPEAVIRLGRNLRVRKDVFLRFVSECSTEDQSPPRRPSHPKSLRRVLIESPFIGKLMGSCPYPAA